MADISPFCYTDYGTKRNEEVTVKVLNSYTRKMTMRGRRMRRIMITAVIFLGCTALLIRKGRKDRHGNFRGQ